MLPTIQIQKTNDEVSNFTISKDYFLVWNFLSDLDKYYLDFKCWFFNKVLPDIATGRRNILIKKSDDQIIAVAILKKHIEETKICTFRVIEDFQGNGVGTELMLESLNWLQCSKPLITVNEEHSTEFEGFLRKFDFQKTTTINGLYRPNKKEIIYNAPTSTSSKNL